MRRVHKLVLDAVLKNLSEHPEEWKATKYELTNEKRNFVIWIANGYYSLHVEAPSVRVGGYAMLGRLAPWRRRVWRAVDRFVIARISEWADAP